MTMTRVTLTAAPCAGVSVILTVSSRCPRRCSAARPRWLRGAEKELLPGCSDARTRLPTRTCFERLRLAGAVLLARSLTSSRAPAPAGESWIEPRTDSPCWAPASLIAFEGLPASGEAVPAPGGASPVGGGGAGGGVVVVPVGVVGVGVGGVPGALTSIVP